MVIWKFENGHEPSPDELYSVGEPPYFGCSLAHNWNTEKHCNKLQHMQHTAINGGGHHVLVLQKRLKKRGLFLNALQKRRRGAECLWYLIDTETHLIDFNCFDYWKQ